METLLPQLNKSDKANIHLICKYKLHIYIQATVQVVYLDTPVVLQFFRSE